MVSAYCPSCHWFFFFFCIPSYISRANHLGEIFCICDHFFNPTIEVVTFHIRGWCMLGVFFVAGICLGQTGSSESMQWNACVHRLHLGFYSHPKEFLGNGVRTHFTSMGKIPSTGGSEQGRTRNTASCRTASQTHCQMSHSSPCYWF